MKKLRGQVKELSFGAPFSEDYLFCDYDKVKLYTGLPSHAMLATIFEFVSADVPSHHRSTTTNFTQFLMTLMLRLNLNDAAIGYGFGVHQSTVSRLILKWINIMYI